MSLYAWVIVCTIIGPFLLSFDKKVHFYTHWKALFPALIIVGLLFLVWDSYFTHNGIWGFNPNYISRIYISNLPLEEVCFFLVVPYACVFIYEVLLAYFPLIKVKKLGHFFAFGFTFAGFTFALMNMENWYTASAGIVSAILTIGIYFINRVTWYGNFVLTFIVAVIPFLIVNSILTGAFTDQPVVWYNENHIIGARIITIPIEDLFYNYAMLLPVIGIFEYLKKRKMSK
jgi:lycopene cyclase domain-containing protein